MIRFGAVASVVAGAVALLVVGAVSGNLLLVYVSIGLAGLALVMLILGVAVWRDQVFGDMPQATVGAQVPADQHGLVHANTGSIRAEQRRDRSAAVAGRPARGTTPPSVAARPERDQLPERDWRGGQQLEAERRTERATRPARERGPVPPDWPGRDAAPAERAPRRPDRAEPYPATARAAQAEVMDDPIRLAHRLGIGRQPSPEAGFPAASARPGGGLAGEPPRGVEASSAAGTLPDPDPLAGSRPVGYAARRGRPSKDAETAAVVPAPPVTEPAPHRGRSGSDAPAESAGGQPGSETPESSTASAPRSPSGTAPDGGPGAPAGLTPPGAVTAADTGSTEHSAAADAASRGPAADADTPGQDGAPAADPDSLVMVVPGIARYHKAGCILIRFLGEDDLEQMSRRDAEAADNVACRACRP